MSVHVQGTMYLYYVCARACVRVRVCMCMWYSVTCLMVFNCFSKVRNTLQYPLLNLMTNQKKVVSNSIIKTALLF